MVISETEILEEEEPKEAEAEPEAASQTDVLAAEVQYALAPTPPLPAPAAGGSLRGDLLGGGAEGEKLEAAGTNASGIITLSHFHPLLGHDFSPPLTPHHLLLTAEPWSCGSFLLGSCKSD